MIIVILVILFDLAFAKADTWTLLNVPWAIDLTNITGIDGDNIVGYYGGHGFLYDGTNWTTIDMPGATITKIYGISGNYIIGEYDPPSVYIFPLVLHGFLYDGTNWTNLTFVPTGISGDNIVGNNILYNITTGTSTVLSYPGARRTDVYGIDGSNLVGSYDNHGFIYNINSQIWTTIDFPGATATGVYDIDGSYLVGSYSINGHSSSFLYNGTVWLTLDVPGAPTGISCNNIVGSYVGGYNLGNNLFYAYSHGYIYTIPAPIACISDGNRTIEAQGAFGASSTLDGSCSSDADSTEGTNDDINDFDWYRVDPCDQNEIYIGSGEIIECNLPFGENIVILEVTDKTGLTDSNEVTITVQDTTPPEFEFSVSPVVLWPPNHKMVKITTRWSVSDNCDEHPEVSLVSVASSEDDDSRGDGHTVDDIQIIDGNIYLRAERSGKGTGRVYTITYKAVDNSGNETVQIATVTVPHNHW